MAAATAPSLPPPPPAPARLRVWPSPAPAEPLLSVVIVNYCQWRNVARLTRQLRRSAAARDGGAEIVVVDNRSPRHPLLGRLRRSGGVSLRRFSSNRGFARAVNEGARLSRGDWVLLLNPDTSVPPGFLDDAEDIVRQALEADPRVGVLGLGVRNADGSPQPSCGPLPTFFGTLAGLFRPRATRRCQPLAAEARTPVAWATGCALLIRKECLEDLGGFDERFFLYYEDVDFCRRARERGWAVCYEPALRVTHHTPLHSRRVPAPLRLMTRHALLTYGVKHWPRWQAALMGGVVWLESAARQAAAWWRGRDEERHFHGQARRIVGDVLKGRLDRARERIREAAGRLEKVSAAQDGKTR
jgi:N-acetylglucosaminyl-diphospho-decaprenol L-rhamnosyltransferase